MKMYKNSHIQNIYKKSKKILNRQFQTGIRTTETDTNKKKHIPNAKRQKQTRFLIFSKLFI